MEGLNYQHLERFWAVVREGGVTRASEKLCVSQPTVSAQLRSLETSLGRKLFTRSGRGLVLTDFGKVVYRYADEIFGLSRDLVDAAAGRREGRSLLLRAGVAMVVPKMIVYRILAPALQLPQEVSMECLEDTPERLVAELGLQRLDLVLTDAPVGPTVGVDVYNHLLGECGVSIMAAPALARAARRGFPGSMDGAPFLLPRGNPALRRSMDRWFEAVGLRPRVVGSFEDFALLKAFAQAGVGFFPTLSPIESEVRQQYGVQVAGRLNDVRVQFYLITGGKALDHPAVVAVSLAARRRLFAARGEADRRAPWRAD